MTVLDLNQEPGIEQDPGSPCIFAGGDCDNPLGFGFTELDDDGSYVSPTYTAGEIRNVVGDTFAVAIGIGYAPGLGDSHVLNYFDMTNATDNEVLAAYDPVSATPLSIGSAPGASAVSDYVLALFDLTGLGDTIEIVFNLDMSSFNDGPDYFFLVSQVTPVPLPAALPLLGAALGGLGLFGWRRKRRASRAPSPAT